jgi:hypothetical protein
MRHNRPIAGTLQAYRISTANTEIMARTVPGSVDAWRKAPSVEIGALIAETLSDLAYDDTRALCYDATIARALDGDAFSARYLLVMDVPGYDATGAVDVSDDEIGALLATLGD